MNGCILLQVIFGYGSAEIIKIKICHSLMLLFYGSPTVHYNLPLAADNSTYRKAPVIRSSHLGRWSVVHINANNLLHPLSHCRHDTTTKLVPEQKRHNFRN